ncbi:MAG: hypothetical protein ACSHXD_07175 [Marinosulfonomonas sp.]
MSLANSIGAIWLAFAILALPFGAAHAQTQDLTTFVAALEESPKEIVDRFSFLSDELDIRAKDGVTYLSYAGLDAPPEFTRFLVSKIPNLPTQSFGAGHAANFSVALVAEGDMTQLRLVMFETSDLDAPNTDLALPSGAKVIFNDGYADNCTGQIVVGYDKPERSAADTFPKWLAQKGYSITDSSDENTSFFIGSKKSCTVFVYVQPDPDTQIRSLIVLRFLED